MRIPKTFAFTVSNLISFTVSLFVSWISFSALATLSDDPFVYGTWPDVIAAASVWTGLVLIIGEIVADFAYEVYPIAIFSALLISFCKVQGHLKGIIKERQIWVQWYHRQRDSIIQGNIFQEMPFVSENIGSTSYFKKAQRILFRLIRHLMSFVVHFSCWFSVFALLATIIQANNGIVEAAHYLVRSFPDIAIPAVIHAFLSNYQGTRGSIKGTNTERQTWIEWYDMWMKWHQKQQGAKAYGYTLTEAPPLPPLNAY